MRTKVSRELVGLIVLLVIFVGVGLFVVPANDGSSDNVRTVGTEYQADPSISNNRDHGSRAFFEWTRLLGYRPAVAHFDWSHLPHNASMLVSIAPETNRPSDSLLPSSDFTGTLTAQDADGITEWLKDGRTLLIMTSVLPSDFSVKDTSGGPPDTTTDDDQFGNKMGFAVQSTQQGNQASFVPLQPNPLVAGVTSIRLTEGTSRAYREKRDYVTLFASVVPLHDKLASVEPAVMVFKVGKGRVIVIADDFFASNRNLPEADNAAFLANVITTSGPRGSVILFDEFHRGIAAESTSMWSSMGISLQSLTIQGILICFLALFLVMPRFGAIKELRRTEARSSGEYLTSLAGLYRRARATVPALDIIYRQFLRDICERLALPTDVQLERLAEVAAKHSNIDPNALKRLIVACETALDKKQLSAGDLLALTRQMEQVKRQLR